MTPVTREQIVSTLQNDWGTYIERFHRLPAAEQAAFLERQGCPHLAGLLGHVTAWWQDGLAVMDKMLADPAFPPPDYDVDAFNAVTTARFANVREEDAVKLFEATRTRLLDFVAGLPESTFADEHINHRLYCEVIGHSGEHPIP